MDKLLSAENLEQRYRLSRGFLRAPQTVNALNGISLSLESGQTLAVVGESGCGKSTLARMLCMIESPSSGQLLIQGINPQQATRAQRKQLRRTVQMVFQNPYASLNPRQRIATQLAEPLKLNTSLNAAQRQARVLQMLEEVGLAPEHGARYPHMFSGGQRQRIAIARAMMLQPALLIADEPTSALDVSVQAQILNLFQSLQQNYQTAYVFISHNLNVVRYVADQLLVMYLGQAAESGAAEVIYQQPLHPYTQALLSATPQLEPNAQPIRLTGELPSPLSPPTGCAFHPRCPRASARCRSERPVLRELQGRQLACHHP